MRFYWVKESAALIGKVFFKSEVMSDTDNDVRYIYMFREDIASEYDLR